MASVSALGLAVPAPRLPHRARATGRAGALSVVMHAGVAIVFVLAAAWPRPLPPASAVPTGRPAAHRPRLVFLQMPAAAGGGGGGGTHQPAPPSRARTIGTGPRALATINQIVVTETPREVEPPPQPIVLATKALDSGTALLSGLPDASPSIPWSEGPGSGGGIGEGSGTGIGAGTGPGLGPGSGGGFGGGAYRPGGGVTAPALLRQVLPKYTPEALERKIQGTVVLEVVIRHDGIPTAIRVVRSLDPGLDAEAVAAVRQWLFAPGRLGNTPVDVLVSIWVDFHVV